MSFEVDGAKVWRLHATEGFPLELSIPLLADRGAYPRWMELVQAALHDGVNPKAFERRLGDICRDSYPPAHAEFMIAGLRYVFARCRPVRPYDWTAVRPKAGPYTSAFMHQWSADWMEC